MKLLVITDIHLTPGGQRIDGRDPVANFAAALDHAAAHHPDAAALIVPGDLSDRGLAEDYALLRRMLDGCPWPVHPTIGNHDQRGPFFAAFPECEGPGGFAHQVAPLPSGHAVLLDTLDPGRPAGAFCDARADWLARTLAELPGPVFLFLHHNPVATGIPVLDTIMLLDADRLALALAPHRDKVAFMVHGHCHLPISAAFQGIPVAGVRGTNHAGWPEFAPGAPFTTADLWPSYGVIFAEPGTVMMHHVEYGYPGEIRRVGDEAMRKGA